MARRTVDQEVLTFRKTVTLHVDMGPNRHMAHFSSSLGKRVEWFSQSHISQSVVFDHSSEEFDDSLMVILGHFDHQLLGHNVVYELN